MKSDSKDSNNITKYFCHINAVLFNFLFLKTILENVVLFPQQYSASQLFLKCIIVRNVSLNSKLEWFLKDHATLKTGVNAAENTALPSQKYIWKYIQIENRYLKC